MFNMLVSIGMYVTILVLGNPNMQTVLFLGTIDRLVTLLLITMTFSYDGWEYFYLTAYCIFCYQDRKAELEIEEQVPYRSMGVHSSSSTLTSIIFTPTEKNLTDEI